VPKLLIVEDEQAMRDLLRQRLEDNYEVIETGDASEALALTLQHKPDCVLLDLMMPKFTGFELCQTLSSISLTRLIPIIIITAYPAAEYKDYCLNLGAKEYFEKPVDFTQLRARLVEVVRKRQPERRTEVRARLKVILKLKGTDRQGRAFELLTMTEDISATGFVCGCKEVLERDSIVEVFLIGGGIDRQAGRARVIRVEWPNTPGQRYGFRFVEKPTQWLLR
jgi:DNA-binding response OmpR family regulator